MATPVVYTSAVVALWNKELDWDTDSFSALLLKDSYTPDQDADVFVADVISGNEPSGGSYARVALASKSVTAASGIVKLLCSDIVFASMTATDLLYGVVYRNTGSDATSKLICYVQFDSNQDPTAQTLTLDLGSNGIINNNVT